MSEKQKMIIDVDTGVDDAQAIMMALSMSDQYDVIAITCVEGNTKIDQVCINTLKVLKICERLDIPVYKGASSAFISQAVCGSNHHHGDGLGGVPDDQPPSPKLIQAEHAVTALVRLVNQYQDEILLVALAPLTNIAMALKMDPEFGKKLKQTVIMGGNMEGHGNVTPASEFNFDFDPEAAYIVLRDLGCTIKLLCWEPCLENGLGWEWFDKVLEKVDTPKAKFHSEINAYTTKRKKEVLKCVKYYSCDPTAMAVALDPLCVLESIKAYCSVELRGELTRGQMVVDWRGKWNKHPNVEIITKVDCEKVRSFYENMVK